LLELSPECCLAVQVGNELAATTTLLCYGGRLAWVGMVLTKEKFRGQGLARQLLSEALRLADQMNIETVKLDATDQGKHLYEKSGFRSEQPVERWFRKGVGSFEMQLQANPLPVHWNEADAGAFGADRSALLKKMVQRNSPQVLSKSFLLSRSGVNTAYLGPCVSGDPNVAHSLIEQCVLSTKAPFFWDLLTKNHEAVAIAQNLGFTPQRSLTRMVRGRDLRGSEESIYALGGFEFG
jgi:predicted GNAT family acetyltransferase